MSAVRIGFVGVGGMGQMAHLKNYLVLPDCEVVAIAELREKTGNLVATRSGITKVYNDHRDMLAKEQLDGVVASQQFGHHAGLLPEIYPHVKAVLTEKPLCINAANGEIMVQAAKKANCTHMVGYHKRSDPATIAAKARIEDLKTSGRLGKLKYVRILMPSGDWIAGGFAGRLDAGDKVQGSLAQEARPNDMDEGTYKKYVEFVNYYIHQVNLMRHLLGEDYKVTYAEKSGVLMATESTSGVPGVIEMTPYRTTIDWQEEALVAFEKGYVRLTLPAPLTVHRAGSVEFYNDPGEGGVPERSQPVLPWVHAMRQQAINFVKVCCGEMAPPCAAEEAVKDLVVARDYIRLRFGV